MNNFHKTAFVLALVMAGGLPLRAEVIDRVLAVVNGAVILQSDSRGALRLGLVEMPAGPEPLRRVLDRLIERRLVLIEVNRSGALDLDEASVDDRLAEVRGRFSSDAEFQAALDENGLTPEQVRAFVRDDLRMTAYLRQRFGTTLEPSEAEVLAFYRLHPERFTREGVLQPFNAVIEEARALVSEERRGTTIQEWIAGLRQRADVTIPAIVRR